MSGGLSGMPRPARAAVVSRVEVAAKGHAFCPPMIDTKGVASCKRGKGWGDGSKPLVERT